MSQLRQQFAKRLKSAMQAAGLDPRPGVLMTQFNLEHRGKSVVFETASRWLKGAAVPDPDKVQTLARLLGVSACYLLFGEAGGVRESGEQAIRDLRLADQKMLTTYLDLTIEKRKLVRELVDELQAGKPD